MNDLCDFFGSKCTRALTPSILSIVLSACAIQQDPKSLGPDEMSALEGRVTERWHAMENKNFAKTYDYTTPNYRRVFPKTLYLNKFSYSVDWELTGVDVVNYDARAAVASVAVRVMSKPAKQTASAAIFGSTPVTVLESWSLVDSEWWHIPKD